MNVAKLKQDYDALRNEYQICKQKLDSKCEALLILTKDLDQCRQERDQFKLMAEQVQQRYQGLKRQLAGVGPRQPLDGIEYTDMKQQSLAQLLCEMREVNKSLQFEVDSQRQKLADAQGDIKLLREQIARHRVGTTDEGMNMRHFPAHEREDLVKQLEEGKEQYTQLERDLQQVLDEKEELVTERDVYKNKFERLNQELNMILKGDEKRVVDIDALVMENRYLQERFKQIEEEKAMANATVSKYKSLLEKKKSKGIIKIGQNRSGGVVISQKQVQQLLENKAILTPTPQMMNDLQSLSSALLETLNDKNLALSHQRKTNKILGCRVSELEQKLKTLEVAGLWSVPGTSASLEVLKKECANIKSLLPQKHSGDSEVDDLESETSLTSPTDPHRAAQNAGLSLEGLDLLPTRDLAKQQAVQPDLPKGRRSAENEVESPPTPTAIPGHSCHDSITSASSLTLTTDSVTLNPDPTTLSSDHSGVKPESTVLRTVESGFPADSDPANATSPSLPPASQRVHDIILEEAREQVDLPLDLYDQSIDEDPESCDQSDTGMSDDIFSDSNYTSDPLSPDRISSPGSPECEDPLMPESDMVDLAERRV